MTLGRDLLENFETWPKHIQDSFLEIVSYQVIVDEEMERQANLSLLDRLMDEFKAVMTLFSQRSRDLVEELSNSEDSTRFIKEFSDKEQLLQSITGLKMRLLQLEGLLKEHK